MKDTTGLRIPKGLKLGFGQLDWQRDQINERANWWRLGQAAEAGWVGQWIGPNLDFGWEVFDQGSGVLAVRSTGSDGTPMHFGRVRPNTARPCVGLDREGNVLEITLGEELLDSTDTPITVPNDGVWYTLVATFRVRVREPGTLSLTGGSVNVTGTGTQFTRYRDSSPTYSAPDRIRIDAADTISGNEGTYVIDTITNDTSLTLTSAPPATENPVEFRISGEYGSGTPADPDIHWNAVVAWSLVARTTTRPTTGLIAYDVRRSGGVLTTINRQRANTYRPIEASVKGSALLPAMLYHSNVDNTAGGGPGDSTAVYNPTQAVVLATGQAALQTMIAMSSAPCAVGSELSGLATDLQNGIMTAMLWDDNTTRRIRIMHYSPMSLTVADSITAYAGTHDDPDNGSAVNVGTTVPGALDVHLLAVPSASGATHLIFYVDSSGLLQLRTSADNGATWSSATNILNPTGAETVTKVSAVLTRMNKIVVAVTWSTGNRIRFGYSSDLGATFDFNSSAGYSSSAFDTAATDVSLVEDANGNLWTLAAVSNTNTVRLYRGASEGSPIPDAAEMTTGWKVGPDASAVVTHLDAFPCQAGGIGLVYGHVVSSVDFGVVGYMQIARKTPIHHSVLVSSPLSAPAASSDTVPVCVGVSAGGMVHVGWGNRYTTTGPLYSLRGHFGIWAPVTIESPGHWFGGA